LVRRQGRGNAPGLERESVRAWERESVIPWAGSLTQRRQGAKAQRGKPATEPRGAYGVRGIPPLWFCSHCEAGQTPARSAGIRRTPNAPRPRPPKIFAEKRKGRDGGSRQPRITEYADGLKQTHTGRAGPAAAVPPPSLCLGAVIRDFSWAWRLEFAVSLRFVHQRRGFVAPHMVRAVIKKRKAKTHERTPPPRKPR
jgi:hypothetical protein